MATTQECCEQYRTSHEGITPLIGSCTATHHPSQNLSKLDELYMQETAGGVGMNSQVTYCCGPLHMDEQRQDDQLKLAYNNSVPIQDVALKTYREQWTAEKGGGRGSGRSALVARHDNNEVFTQLLCHRQNIVFQKKFLFFFFRCASDCTVGTLKKRVWKRFGNLV